VTLAATKGFSDNNSGATIQLSPTDVADERTGLLIWTNFWNRLNSNLQIHFILPGTGSAWNNEGWFVTVECRSRASGMGSDAMHATGKSQESI